MGLRRQQQAGPDREETEGPADDRGKASTETVGRERGAGVSG